MICKLLFRNKETKKIIFDSLVDIPVYKLMLFIMLLSPDKIDAQIECDYFYKLLIKFFGNNHPRSIEINGVCNY